MAATQGQFLQTSACHLPSKSHSRFRAVAWIERQRNPGRRSSRGNSDPGFATLTITGAQPGSGHAQQLTLHVPPHKLKKVSTSESASRSIPKRPKNVKIAD